MRKLLAASAAFLTLAAVGGQGARAWCDEDCAYAAQEAAYERAAEAREAAEEAGYETGDRRPGRSAMPDQRPTPRRGGEARKEPERPAIAKRPARPEPQIEVASENSSIATAASPAPAADDDAGDRIANNRSSGCKTYFPSVGMTLSVRCD